MTGTESTLGRPCRILFGTLALALGGAATLDAQSLRGSTGSLDIQNWVARQHDFTYLRSASQVRRFDELGYLVRVTPNADFELHAVSSPYARPEVALFVRRLASQYRNACRERLVVTSLTRPLDRQPRNASDRSVHPTGMAVDLRLSRARGCRAWLERVLLDLERTSVLEATRERSPPHYHVALFPRPYRGYVDRLAARTAQASPSIRVDSADYRIRPGDSLWTIARRHGVSVSELKATNDLRTNRIFPGQVIQVPSTR